MGSTGRGEVIVVAVDASKEMTDYALEWAVRNVLIKAPAMDFFFMLLLVILPLRGPPPPAATNQTNLYQFLSGLLKKKKTDHEQDYSPDHDHNKLAGSGSDSDGPDDDVAPPRIHRINNVCVQMMQQQLLSLHKPLKHQQVRAEVKVVADAQMGTVAMVAEELGATWVILDRSLKKEADCCVKQLKCNVILIDHAIPNILKSANFPRATNSPNVEGMLSSPTVSDMLGLLLPTHNPKSKNCNNNLKIVATQTQTQSNLGLHNPNLDTQIPLFLSSSIHKNQLRKSSPPTKFQPTNTSPHLNSHFSDHEAEQTDQAAYRSSVPLYSSKSQPLSKVSKFDIESPPKSLADTASPIDKKTRSYNGLLKTRSDVQKSINRVKATESSSSSSSSSSSASFPPPRSSDSPNSLQKLKCPDHLGQRSKRRESVSSKANEAVAFPPRIDRVSSIRRAISLSIKQPPTPPPLCSICKHNAPVFGKAPRRFSYKEMERATNGFSTDNFLAEGGYGSVYRGVLPDGLVVAVKQHKRLSAQGASEFCSEVEVLSCAQHKNLVKLVGYCIQMEWLLVYEFACNGSLDKHLYGGTKTTEVMAWHNRMKVAVGAARGLRYLHEDCRVGCIVHRDFRPNNILLTHDFEPMVGDFGLARWQVDGQSAEETRVIGAFGYLAPEYTQTGLITEKADIYAFGVVLLELLTGIKATEFSRNAGHKLHLPEQGCSLPEKKIYNEIIDPQLENSYVEKEAESVFHAAILCISPHPERRPSISKVLKILEGDMPIYTVSHHGQSSVVYPKQRLLDGYATDGPLYQMLDDSPSQLSRSIHHGMNLLSPSRKSSVDNRNYNDQKSSSKLKPTTPVNKFKVVNGGLDLNQYELIVNQEEYQEYLQGSLSRFIENIIVK